MNLQDIAQLAGVSRSTVSRVINNDPRVSDEVRQRVLETVERSGYRPNAAARALASRRTKNIGLVLPNHFAHYHPDQWFPLILAACVNAASERDFGLLLIMGDVDDPDASRHVIDRFVNAQTIDGLLTLGTGRSDTLQARITDIGFPHVAVGETYVGTSSFVDVDNRAVMAELTSHVISQGVRRIAFVRGSEGYSVWDRRAEGFLDALRAYDIDPALCPVFNSGYEPVKSPTIAQQFFSLPVLPEAIVFSSDWMAHDFFDTAQRRGMSAPADFLAASFDDFESPANDHLGLTAAIMPYTNVAEVAFDVLLERVDNPSLPPTHVRLPSTVRYRRSSFHPEHAGSAEKIASGKEGLLTR